MRGAVRGGSVRVRAIALGLLVTCTVSACAVGPSRRPALAVAGSVTVPVTTATTEAAPRPTGPGGQGQQADPADWEDCPSQTELPTADEAWEVDCAQVEVPLDRTERGSDPIDLAISRARSSATPEAAPSLIVVVGAPGEHGRDDLVPLLRSIGSDLLTHYQVVTLDVRGTRDSRIADDCLRSDTVQNLLSPPADPTDDRSRELIGEISKQAVFDCADEPITDIDTQAAADDLDAVRDALGDDTVALLGQGWGATLGAVYVDRYPGRVSVAVLEGPQDGTATAQQQVSRTADGLQGALAAYVADCSDTAGGCPLGADPAAAVEQILADIGEDGDVGDDLYLTDGSILLAMAHVLGTPSRWPDLTGALRAAQGRDLRPIEKLLVESVTATDSYDLVQPQLEYRCNDSSIRLGAGDLPGAAESAARTAPTFGPFVTAQLGLCTSWPAATTAISRLSGAGAPPVLVTGSTGDPVSPYAGVQSVAGQLSSATLVSWQSTQHGAVTGSACVREIALAYLTAGTEPPEGRLCPP